MNLRLPSIALLMALLAGCTTITAEQRRAADEERCRSYGFKQKNDAFAACMQRIDMERRLARDLDDPWDRAAIVYRPVYLD